MYYREMDSSLPWELTNANVGTDKVLGNEKNPFRGTIYCTSTTTKIYTNQLMFKYLSSKAQIGQARGTAIDYFNIYYTTDGKVASNPQTVTACIAENLELEDKSDSEQGCEVYVGPYNGHTSNYYVNLYKGTISGSNKVGGLFDNVYVKGNKKSPAGSQESIYKIYIGENSDKNGVNLAANTSSEKITISGREVGGLFGNVSGDIAIDIYQYPKGIKQINGNSSTATSCSGGMFGSINSGVVVTFKNQAPLIIDTKIYNSGNNYCRWSGGLVGYVNESKVICDTTAGVQRTGITYGRNYVGSLIGYALNSTVKVNNYTINSGSDIRQFNETSYCSAGGVIGSYQINADNVGTDKLELSRIKSSVKDPQTYSEIRIATNWHWTNSIAGGLVGVINARDAEVYIHDINTDAEKNGAERDNCYYVNMIYNRNALDLSTYTDTDFFSRKGGIAGEMGGTNIKVENIIFDYQKANTLRKSNTMSGWQIGNICAKLGSVYGTDINTKMIVKNVKVLNNYVYRLRNDSNERYYGGLFGTVNKSIVELQGNIDFSNFQYKMPANVGTGTGDDTNLYALYGNLGSTGYLIGSSNASIIYKDVDCVYKRPLTYNKTTGKFDDWHGNSYDMDIIEYANSNNTNSTFRYCIDDIGNAGSLYQNLMSEDGVNKVININNEWGNNVTGKLSKEGDKYVIDSLQDALRLAIAGNSVNSNGYPNFGGNCFVDDGVAVPKLQDVILTADYLLKTNLNLSEAGITGLVTNASIQYAFKGTLIGVQGSYAEGETTNEYPTIVMDFVSRQKYGGLFPNVTGNTTAPNKTFANFNLNGIIGYTRGENYSEVNNNQIRAGAGGLAAYATGGIVIDNVDFNVELKASNNVKTTWSGGEIYGYGGVFGVYLSNNNQLKLENCKMNITMGSARTNSYMAGMIGWIRSKSGNILTKLTVKDCELSVNLTTNKLYQYAEDANGATFRGGTSGLISLISDDCRSPLYNNTETLPCNVSDNTYTSMEISGLVVKDTNFDYSVIGTYSNPNMVLTGGLLGSAWANTKADMTNITVNNSSIKSRGTVGGLVSFAAGIYNLNSITLNGLEMTSIKNGYYCGFLIGNGQNAIVNVSNYTINTNSALGTVSATNYNTFDEMVGINIRLNKSNGHEYPFYYSYDVDAYYREGGILNYINSNFSNFDDSDTYSSYTNKVITTTNKFTRYYYNLFSEQSKINVIDGTGQINSEEQWLTYCAASYCRSVIRRFFNDYFVGNTFANIKNYSVNADLDMKGYSLYATPIVISGTTIDFKNHKVTLYADKVYDNENSLFTGNKTKYFRSNENAGSQHYLMHGALFNNLEESVTIKNLTLAGTAGNYGDMSGGLICRTITGNHTIEGITFDNFKIHNYSSGNVPLMIGKVGISLYDATKDKNSRLVISKIKTINYPEPKTPVASALIGVVGNSYSTNNKVFFKEMEVEDDREKVFKFASYIYEYNYTEKIDSNKSYIQYSFSKQEFTDDKVTFGKEMKDGVHYSDAKRTEPTDPLDTIIANAENNMYNPYIYQFKNIYINPKNGNIDKGCGTYEDPYEITSGDQLLTLYLYLTGNTDYDEMFNASGETGGKWKIVPVGGEDGNKSECSEGPHVAVSFGDADFPTREELCTAYYTITNDINLQITDDLNYINISNEYSGLGSKEVPFAGVIIGNNHKVILPKQGRTSTKQQLKQANFGLIQFMAGAVVKDLKIEANGYFEQEGDKKTAAYYNVSTAGGGVAAMIVGGDNIIDNVEVKINFNTGALDSVSGTLPHVGLGGLVGIINDGTLIIRNMQNNNSTKMCVFDKVTNNSFSASILTSMGKMNDGTYVADGDLYSYPRGKYNEVAGTFVGRVLDGVVLYEGYTKSSSEINEPIVLNNAQMGINTLNAIKYPLINGFLMINENVLKNSVTTNRITFSKNVDPDDANKYNYEALINNADQLEIFSMALNSDALSVYYRDDKAQSTGYNYYTRCRKASYSDVGTKNKSSADRNMAVNYDDNKKENVGYLYPYLCYKYFDYSALSTNGATALDSLEFANNNYLGYVTTLTSVNSRKDIVSNVNKMIPEVANYTTTYKLETNAGVAKDYDLTKYDISFRGIGAIYSTTYSDFRGNFDGNNNNITYRMVRSFDVNDEKYIGIKYSGLFNTLIYNTKMRSTGTNVIAVADENAARLEIKNINLKNIIVYNPYKHDYNTTGRKDAANYGIETTATGGLVGKLQGRWNIENIKLTRNTAISDVDTSITSDVSGYKSVGGLVGRISSSHFDRSVLPSTTWINERMSYSNDIIFCDCDVTGTSDNNVKITELGTSAAVEVTYKFKLSGAGGLIGTIATNIFPHGNIWHGTRVFGNVYIKKSDIDYLTVTMNNKGDMGGLVGFVGARYKTDDNADAWGSSAGNIYVDGRTDELENSTTMSSIKHLTLTSHNMATSSVELYSAGGMFGRCDLMYEAAGLISIRNYNLQDISIAANTDNTSYSTRYEKTANGGVIGYERCYKIDINKVELDVNTMTKNIIGSELSPSDAGGLIGMQASLANNNDDKAPELRNNAQVYINNCKVKNTRVLSKYGICGGFVGFLMNNTTNIGSDDTSNEVMDCEIKSGNGGDTACGGIVGEIYNDKRTKYDTLGRTDVNIINTYVKNTDILNGKLGSGGIVGYAVASEHRGYLKLKNCEVYSISPSKGKIISTGYAGGLIGYQSSNDWGLTMEGRIGVGTYYATMNSEWSTLTTSGVNIKGKYSGGICGWAYERYPENNTADICVANNVIYAYDTNTSNNQPDTYSGGLYGRLQVIDNINIKYNTVNIKNNVIINGGNAKGSKIQNDLRTYTGGIYGYYYGNNGSTSYLPYITLDNNSIGYYDGSDKVDGWINVTVSGANSADVKLYDSTTTTIGVKNWRDIDELSSKNVGNYSLGVGQFMGGYGMNNNAAHIYILDPKVILNNAIGSIPVVDVGNNGRSTTSTQRDSNYQTGYPYAYRNSVHIVYRNDMSGTAYNDVSKTGFEDTSTGISTNYPDRKPKYIDDSLLISGSNEYHFGVYETIVSNYRDLNNGVSDKAVKNYNFITSDRLNAYLPYNSTVASICNVEDDYDNYYKLAYEVYDDNNVRENIINNVPVLMFNGLLAQYPADAVALALTNGGGAVSQNRVDKVTEAFGNNVENSTLNQFWSITCENAYIDPDGVIHKMDDSMPDIYNNHRKSSVNVEKLNKLGLEKQVYDELFTIEGKKYYTITLVKYTYTCKGAVNDNSFTMYIPIFVKEKVSVDTYIRILSNEEYSLENARNIGYTTTKGTMEKVTISHDSTYTIYVEFIYDAIRNKTNFRENKLEKSLNYYAEGIHFITEGTRFTLIDYQTGISYYYTAVAGQADTIPFSDFRDENNQPYTQRNIGADISLAEDTYTAPKYLKNNNPAGGQGYSDVDSNKGIGVERFFIVVEPPESQNTGNVTLSFETKAWDESGNNVDAFFTKNSLGEDKVIMECTPGPIVSLGGIEEQYENSDDYYTYIAGKISNDTTVNIDANIQVTLKDDELGLNPYWKYKIKGNTIDSANTGKYLELAITLVNDNNDVVKWPTGTNISINGNPKQVLSNSMVIYTYKDLNKKFEMNNVDNNLLGKCFYYDITEGSSPIPNKKWIHKDIQGNYFYYSGLDNDQNWVRQYLDNGEIKEEYIDISNQLNVELDFSVADLEEYSGNYKVIIQLYRSDDPNYPSESSASANSSSGTTVRQYSKNIAGEAKKELAVAVAADDLLDLGINLYNKDKDVFDIPFMSKIDFTDMIHKSKIDVDVAEMAGQKYLATYRIYKKVDTGGNGTDIGNNNISYNEIIGSVISNSNEFEYQIMDWNDPNIPFKLYKGDGTLLTGETIEVNEDVDAGTKETQSVIRMVKTFTDEEIKNGIPDAEGNQIEYVTNWGMRLDVDSTKISDEELTNYMVKVTYLPYKTEDAPINDQDALLNDYFVFTIAKLKTDF